jgi:hypothetical protein
MEGKDISLELFLEKKFLPVLLAVVENSAQVFRMGTGDKLKLTLAAEEIFTYLCNNAGNNEKISIHCQNGGYYVRLDLVFQVKNFNLRALNLNSNSSMSDQAWLEEMGLLIAARSIDYLQLTKEYPDKMRLSLCKEKTYPLLVKQQLQALTPAEKFSVRAAGVEESKEFCQRVIELCPAHGYPSFLYFPGKFVDMTASGEYAALIAFDEKESVRGGIIWTVSGDKTIECFGPYVFTPWPGMNEALLDEFIARAGRSGAPGIINRHTVPEIATKYFELLGSTKFYKPDGTVTERLAYYRQLSEDAGSRVWAHADLLDFLRKEYERLFLPRDIHTAGSQGEQKNPYSVFTTEFDLVQDQVVLRMLMPGEDAGVNLGNHLMALQKEKHLNTYMEIDLGQAWQVDIVPNLFQCGFKPRLILPYAGERDLLLFQYEAGDLI